MAKNKEPVVEVWGLEEFDSRRLKQLDYAKRRGLDPELWAYPVFTSRAAALEFADMLTEDYTAPDAELFRQRSREKRCREACRGKGHESHGHCAPSSLAPIHPTA